MSTLASRKLPPFTQPRTKGPPPILTQLEHIVDDEPSPQELSPVDPPAITTPSNAAIRVIERAATKAIDAGTDRIGHKIKYKASSAGVLLTTQLEQARKVKHMQNSARRALTGGKGRRKSDKRVEDPGEKTILIILKSAVVRASHGNQEKVPVEVRTPIYAHF